MSTTFAFDDGEYGAGPSTVRAYLHALALKLHRLGLAIKDKATNALRFIRTIPRRIADATMTTVNAVFSRSGFEAAVSLLLAGGQLVGYAVRATAIRCGRALHRIAGSARTTITTASDNPQVQRWTTRISDCGKNPWIAAAAIAAIVVLLVIATWLGLRPTSPGAGVPLQDIGDARFTNAQQVTVLSQEDLEQVMSSLYVVLGQDGSIRVHGIPTRLDDDATSEMARIAASAANSHLNRMVRRGRPLSTDDLSSVNIAARHAVAQHFDGMGRAA